MAEIGNKTHTPEEFVSEVLGIKGITPTDDIMRRVIIEAIEKWELTKASK